MTDKPYTPTVMQVERAYLMRQSTLDQEDGKEPQPLVYAAEFRHMIDQVRAEAKAEALRDFADAHRVPFIMFQGDNYVVTVSDLLRGQARRYLGEPDEYSKGKL